VPIADQHCCGLVPVDVVSTSEFDQPLLAMYAGI
jgi:hypothetical protein